MLAIPSTSSEMSGSSSMVSWIWDSESFRARMAFSTASFTGARSGAVPVLPFMTLSSPSVPDAANSSRARTS